MAPRHLRTGSHVLLLSFLFVLNTRPQNAPPQNREQEIAAARVLIEQGKIDEAIARLKEMELREPKLEGVARGLGTAYYKKNDFVQVVSYLKRALEEDPDDKEAVQLLGLSYYRLGRPADAIPLLEKVQSWFPVANVDASYVLGLCYIQTKNYAQAQKAFATMFNVPEDSAASHLFLARMLFRQEFDPIAEEQAQKAVALDPKLPLGHFLLGELYMYKSRIPEAIAEFEKELQINPAHAATYYKLADAYSRVMKFEESQRLLQRSIWLDETASGPFVLMGKVLLKKGETELAVLFFQRALRMDPNNFVGHHLLGQAYQKMGKTADAERELKLAEQLQKAQTTNP